MMESKACNVTGIVAIACARHGCFAPNSIADLFCGEQQKNVDWVLLQALKSTHVDPAQGAMLIYNIACQYFVHLQERIGHLLPEGSTLDHAIGLFHVHGHKDNASSIMQQHSFLVLQLLLVKYWKCFVLLQKSHDQTGV